MKPRHVISALSLSMIGFLAIVKPEGYTAQAVIPTKNDRPTVGFGSTFHADGSPVKMGDTTTPVRALVTAQAHITKEEKLFQASMPGARLNQDEYDLYMDWVYQYGTGAWAKSSMRKHILAGDYVAACDALLLYKKSGGYDSSVPGNKICAGVWTRQLERHKTCIGAQS